MKNHFPVRLFSWFLLLQGVVLVPLLQAAPTYPATSEFASGTVNGMRDPAMPYRYLLPADYNLPANATTKYPLVIFLHGAGERGNNNTSQLGSNANGAMVFVAKANPNNQLNYPCIFLAPQCGGAELTEGDWHMPAPAQQIGALVRGFIKNYRVDPDRVYVTGLSAGGNGAWLSIDLFPELFAASIPICGWIDDWGVDPFRRMVGQKVNIWAFCNDVDNTVGTDNTETPVVMHWAQKGRAMYTRYTFTSHDAWSATYNHNNTKLVPWLMAQQRGQWSTSDPATIALTSSSITSNQATLTGTATDNGAGLTSIKIRNAISDATTTFPNKSKQIVNATGVATWSASPVPLVVGTNLLSAIGVGPSLSALKTGSTFYPVTFDLNTLGGVDTVPPVITRLDPAGNVTISGRMISVSGTASDAGGLAAVMWFNDRTGNGKAVGTTSWQANSIPLFTGANVLTFVAFDNAGNTSSTSLTVTVTGSDSNQAPLVHAGADMVCPIGGGHLQARTVDDDMPVFGQALTYAWTQVSGPGTTRISGANSRRPYFDNFSVAGEYVYQCAVSDGALTGTDTVKVIYNPAASGSTPLLNAGLDETIYFQGSSAVVALEPIVPTGTLAWTKVSGPGTVSFVLNKAVYYGTFSAPGTYVIRATATNGSLVSTDDLTITVKNSVNYNEWKSQQAWNGGDSNFLADADGDGLSNLVEYALGLSPVTPSASGAPAVSVVGPNLTFNYSKDTTKTDVVYQVQVSPDMVTWSNAASVRTGPAGTVETWTASLPFDTAKKFLRLQVTK
jgi:poly(3-hydroxybutyrate) depolymerase